MPRRLTEADRAEWSAYARDLRLLPGRPTPAALPPPAAPPVAPPTPRIRVRGAGPLVIGPLVVGRRPTGIDSTSWTRFAGGKLRAQRRLDLHGRTAQHAYAALEPFLHAARADGLRCVEVITGRGSGEAGGILKRELPHWLNAPTLRPLILAVLHPHAANPGSVRVLLRARRA